MTGEPTFVLGSADGVSVDSDIQRERVRGSSSSLSGESSSLDPLFSEEAFSWSIAFAPSIIIDFDLFALLSGVDASVGGFTELASVLVSFSQGGIGMLKCLLDSD